MTKRQIIAMGGGGFSMEPDNLALDEYILRQTDAVHPKVCFLPTASGDADGYILNFYKAFSSLACRPSYRSLFRLPTADLEDYLLEQHVIYVGGGNTRSMLALWHEWGLGVLLRKAYEAARRPSLHRLLLEHKLAPGYAADDGAAVHFVNEQLLCAVSSRATAKVYSVKQVDGKIVEKPLEMRYLGR